MPPQILPTSKPAAGLIAVAIVVAPIINPRQVDHCFDCRIIQGQVFLQKLIFFPLFLNFTVAKLFKLALPIASPFQAAVFSNRPASRKQLHILPVDFSVFQRREVERLPFVMLGFPAAQHRDDSAFDSAP